MKKVLFVMSFCFILTFLTSLSFAEARGPVIQNYYIGMSFDQIKEQAKKSNCYIVKDTLFIKCHCIKDQQTKKDLALFHVNDGDGTVDFISFNSLFFGIPEGTWIKTEIFLDKFYKKYNLEFYRDPDCKTSFIHINKVDGFRVEIVGLGAGFSTLKISKIETDSEKNARIEQERLKEKNVEENIKF